jgi:hypothetical protein
MNNSTQIHLLRTRNPHRFDSLDRRRFALLIEGMTVGQFVETHNATGTIEVGGLGERWHAVRYLKYMRDRGYLELPGEVVVRRAPRLATVSPLSGDLSGFTFGVELECYLNGFSHRSAAEAITGNADVQCTAELYNHQIRNYWKVVTDCSLGNYTRGAEFVSPILQGDAGLQQVKRVCHHLKQMRTKATKKYSLHVHVGARGRDAAFFANLLKLYGNNEHLIDQLVPPSRRNNHYCCTVRHAASRIQDGMTLDQIFRLNGNRFSKLNFASFGRHGTVEFRQAAGTVDADKVTYWVKFCLRLCAAATAGINQRFESLEAFFNAIGATAEEQAWLTRRAARLATADQQRRAA